MSELAKSYDAPKALSSFYKIPSNFPLSGCLPQEKHFVYSKRKRRQKASLFLSLSPKCFFYQWGPAYAVWEKNILGDRERKCERWAYVWSNSMFLFRHCKLYNNLYKYVCIYIGMYIYIDMYIYSRTRLFL